MGPVTKWKLVLVVVQLADAMVLATSEGKFFFQLNFDYLLNFRAELR